VQRAYDHVALFRRRMEERRLKPADLHMMDDIVKLPFTVKTDLRDTYPYGLAASPLQEIVRFHASSGTKANPSSWPIRRKTSTTGPGPCSAVSRRAACIAATSSRSPTAMACSPRPRPALRRGSARRHVIPISGGNTDRQIMLMKDFGVTVICCTPSYFLHLIDRANEMG